MLLICNESSSIVKPSGQLFLPVSARLVGYSDAILARGSNHHDGGEGSELVRWIEVKESSGSIERPLG